MKRVLILGSAGSGKSTLAPKVARALGIPCVHLDQLFWLPGWVEPERKVFERKLVAALKKKAWVMDGHFGTTQSTRLKYADTVVYLDANRWVCIWRVLKRIASSYGTVRADMAEGCPEQWDWGFLKWVWNYPENGGRATMERLSHLKLNQKLLILRSTSEVKSFLASLSR